MPASAASRITKRRQPLKKLSRNRSPCKQCQTLKRKCDSTKPPCSRCRNNNLACEPSTQASWRVETIRSSAVAGLNSQASANLRTEEAPSTNLGVSHSAQDMPSNNDMRLASSNSLEVVRDGTGRHTTSQELHTHQENHQDGTDPSAILACFDGPQFLHPLPWVDVHANPRMMLSIYDQSYNDTFLNDLDLLVDGMDFGESPIQQINLPRAEDHNDVIETIRTFSDDSNTTVTSERQYLLRLWKIFRKQIAPSLTALGNSPNNPLLRYLVPTAEKCPSVLVAVLSLTQAILKRSEESTDSAGANFLDKQASSVLHMLEIDGAVPSSTSTHEPEDQEDPMIFTLSTIVVFCMSFVADKDASRLVTYIEYASIICRTLFKTHADDERFLYLVKLLGFMQNSVLFSSHDLSIDAPDYLGVAIETKEIRPEVAFTDDGSVPQDLHFRDIDSFSGMSASMASIIYNLGKLVRRKKASTQSFDLLIPPETVRAFETEVDGVEVRLRRHLALLAKRQTRVNARANTQPAVTASVAHFLDAYNEAVFWSAWSIFLTHLKDRSWSTETEVQDTAKHILDAYAEVPLQNAAASLLVFPLVVGGASVTNKVYREFVLERLQRLKGSGLTDTEGLCDDLERHWNTSEQMSFPLDFTAAFLF